MFFLYFSYTFLCFSLLFLGLETREKKRKNRGKRKEKKRKRKGKEKEKKRKSKRKERKSREKQKKRKPPPLLVF